ncbi:MAG: DUF3568 family protein [Gemmatimonadaceae bacterium]
MHHRALVWRLALAAAPLALPLSLSGCFLIAAGAGAAGAIAYTNRGATSDVAGTVDDVFGRAVSAFRGAGISETGRSSEDNGTKRKLVGSKGEQEVTVELTRSNGTTTKVEVVAKKNAVDYDKELAKDVLNRILQK